MSNFSSFFDSRESRNLENEKKWLENSRDSVKSCFFHHPKPIFKAGATASDDASRFPLCVLVVYIFIKSTFCN